MYVLILKNDTLITSIHMIMNDNVEQNASRFYSKVLENALWSSTLTSWKCIGDMMFTNILVRFVFPLL